ncbi:2-hydroxyacid dehydrogenase [Psychroflexus halocasei]|uniref:Glyoxylate/hydroxypyruvate reductase A n=1 Tax=Psychroflexus halocasei TaxID=908615 RepID=A0A1H3XMF2_9FLAO|nr:glyoxylate/hydroxypyruvate reductase A [Psychroflexus halocasei]SDZ99718.1 glyoxylate/hydroxypyruvate reductase A [Psychroflexus halocasei]
MSILLVCQHRDSKPWFKAFNEKNPDLDIQVYPEVENPDDIEFAISWRHPEGIYKNYPNLKVIASMGAGVHHVLKDQTIPDDVKITRIVDENLTRDMADFALLNTLFHIRNYNFHIAQQQEKNWQIKAYRQPQETKVGILGMGVLGQAVAEKLNQNDFQVLGWSKSKKENKAFRSFTENEFDEFMSQLDILICLLPLTEETEGVLNYENLKKLPQGAKIINLARGPHVVDDDLLKLLDEEHLSSAILDVFDEEPLPKNSPYWSHPKVLVTPHVASMTDPQSVVNQIYENIENMKNGKDLKNQVDRSKKY